MTTPSTPTQATASAAPSKLQWLRHFLIYGFGVYSISALSFLVVPIYTRRISAAEYGVLELLSRAQDVLGLVILSGLGVAALAFFQFEKERPERQKLVFSTALLGVLANSILVAVPLVVWAPQVARVLFHSPEYAWAVRIFGLLIPLETIFQVGLISLQAQMKSGTYVIFTTGRFVVGLVLNLILVFWLRLGLTGILTALVLHTGLPALLLLGLTFHRAQWRVSWGLWKELVAYGLPFIPGGLFLFVLNSGDRYFLNLWHGETAVGIYGVSYKLGSIVMILILAPFLKIWGSVMIGTALQEGGPRKIAHLTLYLSAAYIYVGLLVSLAAPPLIRILAGPGYEEAIALVPLITLAYLFWALSLMGDTAFYATKQTRFKPVVLLVAGLFCLLSYVTLIPRFAGLGAAWATVLSFAFLSLLTFVVGRRFLPIPFEGRRFTILLAFAAFIFLISNRLTVNGVPAWACTLAAAALFPASLWLLGFWTPDEKVGIVDLASRLRARLRGAESNS
jgi:O-antigen/teichoic acid export membrane protein